MDAEREISTLVKTAKKIISEVQEDLLPINSAQFYCLVAELDSSKISPGVATDTVARSIATADYSSLTANPTFSSTSESGGTYALQAGSPAAADLIVRSPDLNFLAVYMTGFCATDGTDTAGALLADEVARNNAPLAYKLNNLTENYRLQVYDNWRNRNWFPYDILGSMIFGQSRQPYKFPKGFIIPAGTTLKFKITNLNDSDVVNTVALNIRLAQFAIMGYLLPKASFRSRG